MEQKTTNSVTSGNGFLLLGFNWSLLENAGLLLATSEDPVFDWKLWVNTFLDTECRFYRINVILFLKFYTFFHPHNIFKYLIRFFYLKWFI